MVSLARAGFCVYRRDLSAQNPPEGKHSLPAKSVILTFDDGEMGFLNVGVPLLE